MNENQLKKWPILLIPGFQLKGQLVICYCEAFKLWCEFLEANKDTESQIHVQWEPRSWSTVDLLLTTSRVCVCVCLCAMGGTEERVRFTQPFQPLGSWVLWDAVERMGPSRPASFTCPVGVPDVGSSISPRFGPAPPQSQSQCLVHGQITCYNPRKEPPIYNSSRGLIAIL